jgi:hypothetical protein
MGGGIVTPPFAMSAGEIAAATPMPRRVYPEIEQLTFERNAYRDRCHALERMVAFLTGREPEPAIDRTAKLEAQRDILIELLAGAALPRNI